MIPLKLETLLNGRVVEQDRVEYKRGWNPTETIQTICAYANDFYKDFLLLTTYKSLGNATTKTS